MSLFSEPEINFIVEEDLVFAVDKDVLLERMREDLPPHTYYEPDEEDMIVAARDYAAHLLEKKTRFERTNHLSPVAIIEPHQSNTRQWSIAANPGLDIRADFNNRAVDQFLYAHEDYVSTGLRITTPLQYLSDYGPVYSGLMEVQEVLTDGEEENADAGTWWQSEYKGQYVSWVNDICGVNIKIGFHPDAVPFETIQNLFAIWSTFERQIENMYLDRDRYQHKTFARTIVPVGSTEKNFRISVYNTESLPELSKFMFNPENDSSRSKLQVLRQEQVVSIEKPWPANFEHAYVDFREHTGTLNADTIMEWVNFIACVTRFAHVLTEACLTFDAFGEALGLNDLIEIIGYT
ncbi:MAG: hypothetical protein M1837_003154 [Sclerophora amabilis]|nr:MAG: hypothetical protein M1837_003154 [Sclerophora amabilis]